MMKKICIVQSTWNSEITLIKKLSNNVSDKEIIHNIDLLFIDGDHKYNSVLIGHHD